MIPQDRCVKHRSITEIDSHRSHRLVMCEQNPCRPDRDNARAILHIVNIASFYSPSLLKRNQPWKGCEGPNMKEKEIQVVSVRGVNCNFIFHSFFTISLPHVKESGFRCPEILNVFFNGIWNPRLWNPEYKPTKSRLVSSDGRAPVCRAAEVAGSNPGSTNT